VLLSKADVDAWTCSLLLTGTCQGTWYESLPRTEESRDALFLGTSAELVRREKNWRFLVFESPPSVRLSTKKKKIQIFDYIVWPSVASLATPSTMLGRTDRRDRLHSSAVASPSVPFTIGAVLSLQIEQKRLWDQEIFCRAWPRRLFRPVRAMTTGSCTRGL